MTTVMPQITFAISDSSEMVRNILRSSNEELSPNLSCKDACLSALLVALDDVIALNFFLSHLLCPCLAVFVLDFSFDCWYLLSL